MIFSSQYSDSSECKFRNILPFFGFERDKETNFRSRGVYVSDANALSGKSKVYRRESYEEDVLVRKVTPTGKAWDLEAKFIQLASPFDGKRLPYISTSVKDFYCAEQRHKLGLFRPVFKTIAKILIGIWLLSYSYTFPLFKQQFGYDVGCVLFVFAVPGLLFLIGWLIDMIRENLYDRHLNEMKDGYSKLSGAQKEELRQQYFADMEKQYGKEAGAVLKEYAILKGYDRK